MIDKIQVVYKKVKDLVPYAKNARLHSDEQVTQLVNAIKRFGWTTPILLDEQNEIIAGHGRIMAAKSLKMTEVPTIVLRGLSDDEKAALRIADNKIAMNSEWNMDFLKDELKSLDLLGFDLDLTGFGKDELKTILADPIPEGKTDPDAIPENVETRCKPGDLWILGDHRLLCGDSTNIQHVERLMDGKNADITFTSPPYNYAKNSHLNGQVGGFENKYDNNDDAMSDDDYRDLLTGFTSIALAKSRYVFVNLQLLAHNRIPLAQYWGQFQTVLKDILIWNKRQAPPNIVKGAFNTRFEFVFCFSDDCKTRGFPADWRGQYPNVIETESNAGNEFAENHRAGFPIAFPLWFFEKFDFAKEVYEPFCGTGTTLIACEKTGRKCYGMEIDPHYCDIIIERWEKFTGKQAQLSNG